MQITIEVTHAQHLDIARAIKRDGLQSEAHLISNALALYAALSEAVSEGDRIYVGDDEQLERLKFP